MKNIFRSDRKNYFYKNIYIGCNLETINKFENYL